VGAASLLAAATFGLVAIGKERQMEACVRLGKPRSYAVQDYDSTIHASFLTLVTAPVGFLLSGIGNLILIGGGPAVRLAGILTAVGTVRQTAAGISHFDHPPRWMGRSTVLLVILGAALNPLGTIPGIIDPAGVTPIQAKIAWLLWGACTCVWGVTLAMIAFRRRAQATAWSVRTARSPSISGTARSSDFQLRRWAEAIFAS